MATLSCQQCGTTFESISRKRRYCSGTCYHKSQIGKPKTFTRPPKGRPRSVRGTIICAGCGQPIQVLASMIRQRKYCSHDCYLRTRVGAPRKKWAKVETRVCLVCGKTFDVGGGGRPPRRQRLCSDACQRKSRYRTGSQAKTIAERDAIYLAAFVDGEGSIMLGARRDTASAILSVSNTKRVVLDWIIEATSVGRVQHQRAGTEKHAAVFFWRCTGDAAESVLRQIAVHLKLKRRQAEIAIAFQEWLRDPALKADRSWQHEAMAQIRKLNRRGPAM